MTKIKDEDGYLLGNFIIGGEGIFYYKKGSQIMSPKENEKSLETYDGFISFEHIKEIFETLQPDSWDSNELELTKKGTQVTLKSVLD